MFSKKDNELKQALIKKNDRCDKTMRERSLDRKTKIVCKNTGPFGLTFGLVMGGLVVGEDKIITFRKLAPCLP